MFVLSNVFFRRSLWIVSSLMKPILMPGWWQEENSAYWKDSVCLKCVRTSRIDSLLSLSPLLDTSIQKSCFCVWSLSRKFYGRKEEVKKFQNNLMCPWWLDNSTYVMFHWDTSSNRTPTWSRTDYVTNGRAENQSRSTLKIRSASFFAVSLDLIIRLFEGSDIWSFGIW